MDCPKEIRLCPHGWTDCDLCANLKACDAGTYVPETELTEHELEVDLGITVEDAEVIVPEIRKESKRGTWAEEFLRMSPNDRMKEFYRYKTSNLHYKEPIPLDGGPVPGGGSKSKNHKKPLKKTPEYMKFLGM